MAIDSTVAVVVTPNPPSTVPSPGGQLSFSANVPVTWSVNPSNGGSIIAISDTAATLTVANPLPNGLLSLDVIATPAGGTASRTVNVPLRTPIAINTGPSVMPTGGQAFFSANVPVTWEVSAVPGVATINPTATVPNAFASVVVSANPSGNPATFVLIARDARAVSDPRFQDNALFWIVTIQYINNGSPSANGQFNVANHNGSAAATWTFGFTDPQGPQNINWMAVHFTTTGARSFPNSCLLIFFTASGSVNLSNDAGDVSLEGVSQQDEPLRNSQCLIEMKGVYSYTAGNVRYLVVPAFMSPSFTGPRDIYLNAGNNQGLFGYWPKVASFWPMFYDTLASSLTSFPPGGNGVAFTTRLWAMNNFLGGSVDLMGITVRDTQNRYCQVLTFPNSAWVYLVSNSPSAFDGTSLPNNSYVLQNARCSVPVSSVKIKNYASLVPSAPYALFDAQIQANSPIRGTTQTMNGQIFYFLNSNWITEAERYLGLWLIPGLL
ncbi:MAG: hypothetical protein K2X03_22580 [Bryobacteraceae bacterium]|nr:hypothetical protein [Bryobacteraceae bacterium]